MKRLVIYFFLIYLFAWKIVGWSNLANAATLTTQAKNILTTELHNNDITDQFKIDEVRCLAENIYFEARAESEVGKAAVGNTTKNRVLHTNWPNTYCEVVKQGPVRESWKTRGKDVKDEDRVYWPIKHRCQFSWYCDGLRDIIWANKERTGETIEANARAWRDSVKVAIYTLGHGSYRVNDNTKGSLYYYAHNLVYPTWAERFTTMAIIGNHTFMRPE